MSFNPAIHDGKFYLDGGREDLDGSKRIIIHPDSSMHTFEERLNGVWVHSSVHMGAETLWLGEEVGLSGAGHNLKVVEGEGGKSSFLAHTTIEDNLTIRDIEALYLYDYQVRVVINSDEDGEWTGTKFENTTNAIADLMTDNIYLKTGATAATADITYCLYKGIDDQGEMVFQQTYPASDFPSNTEVRVHFSGLAEFENGVTYYGKWESTGPFSLKTNVAQTERWMASDLIFIRRDNLLQTKPWEEGVFFTNNEYFINDRQIYICNTGQTFTGDFASNIGSFDLFGNKASMNYLTLNGNDLEYDAFGGDIKVRYGNIQSEGVGGGNTNFVGGFQAGNNMDAFAKNNVIIGGLAGGALIAQDDNVILGYNAGSSADVNNAVLIGHAAGGSSTGDNGVVIGHGAGTNNATVEGCVYIGKWAGYGETVDNKLHITNNNTFPSLIEGDFANDWLKINGDLTITDDLTITGILNPITIVDDTLGISDSLADFSSNSADTNFRELVSIHNNNPLAIGAIGLGITQDANTEALEINAIGVTTGIAMSLNANNLTTGTGFRIYSNSNNNQDRTLLHLHNDNISALDTVPLRITQDSSRANSTAIHIESGDIKLFNDSDLAIDIGNIIMTAGGSIYLADDGKIQVQGGDIQVLNGGNIDISGGGYLHLAAGRLDFSDEQNSRFIVPRKTTTQRDNYTGTNGEIIYNTSINVFQFFENNSWVTK